MRISKDEWAMSLAFDTAVRSTCLRRAVGCVLLNKAGHILSTGYNGVASGRPHCNQETADKTLSARKFIGVDTVNLKDRGSFPYACAGAHAASGTHLDDCEAIHAEQNALLQCRDVYQIETCYVTVSPCVTCVKLLLNTSCQTIVFGDLYPQPAAARLWQDANRAWIKLG